MPVTPTYPGVYIEEIPSGVRTITGVATSITAFIGATSQGPTNRAVLISSFSDFERQFGGLWVKSTLGYMVQQFFLNGGSTAIIVRVVPSDATAAEVNANGLELSATSKGAWMNGVKVIIDHNTRDADDTSLFNLTIATGDADRGLTTLETFRNLSTDPDASRFVKDVLAQGSSYVDVKAGSTIAATRPDVTPTDASPEFANGIDGGDLTYGDYDDSTEQTGLSALDRVDIFNLLCIAPKAPGESVAGDDGGVSFLATALKKCEDKRAMLIVDPPIDGAWSTVAKVAEVSGEISGLARSKNAVVYYPNVVLADPLKENRLAEFPPSGMMAGVMSRIDTQRGVWKASAGTEATLAGVRALSYKLNDAENGQLNPLGVNCLRSFPVYGNVAWGARTLEGADQLASEWKYLPVRRLALFLEESLYRGTQWVVFEPNDEPLWSQIRLNIGAFMNNLFKQGAFQGSSPKEAYFVKCDKETTTQNDINLGIVNILVGYAPLKPAEFVILKFQQMAGQLET
jgi:uncharacterized protein